MSTQYFMPTQVFAGKNCLIENAAEFAKLGSKALIVTGAHSAKACGALEDVTAALSRIGCTYTIYNQVPQNPTISCVFSGVEKAREISADYIIAIGGGSPMDAGKAIALLAKNPQLTAETLFSGSYPGGALPIAAVPTTAGTGSEVTKASILTNDAAQTKSSIANPLIFPQIAFLDGRYTEKLPLVTTVNTAIDALTHAAEGMLSCKAGMMTDCLAKEALGRIAACFPAMQSGDISPMQRSSLLAASTLAGIVIANTGTTAVHAMGYSLTYFKHIAHGRANGLIFPAFLKFMYTKVPNRVQDILVDLGCETVEQLTDIFTELLGRPEPLTLPEAEQFASIAIQSGNIKNCLIKPSQADLLNIYKASFSLE
ncbi:MAG: iron-containing alcohol dehydrogenase family protein [Oscillospiraceae bacterium]|nr:iron-containing alcohol dehydrogenase family protein [Oscillospiraceae bacterium]